MPRAEFKWSGSILEDCAAKSVRVHRHRNGTRKSMEQIMEDNHSGSYGFFSEGSSVVTGSSKDGYDSDEHSQKSNPSPLSDASCLAMEVQLMEKMFSNVFTAVSALKKAYIRMQAAHRPYNPEELQLADKAVIAELRKLSEIKHAYHEKRSTLSRGVSSDLSMQPELQSKDIVLKSYQGTITSLRSDVEKKEAEMENLKETLAQMTFKKEKLERRVKRLEQRFTRDSYTAETSPTPFLFESMVQGASEAARGFTKLLLSLMKEAQWDLDAASNSIEPGLYYARRAYRRYAFESYVCNRMFNGFEKEDFGANENVTYLDLHKHQYECFSQFLEMRHIDPLEIVTSYPDCLFAKFCQKKFVELVHPKMEESFFGNFDHRNQVTKGEHPETQFYQTFLKLAKAIWLVHQLAFAFEPAASIFYVSRGTDFSPSYMESIVQSMEIDEGNVTVPPKVGFSVMPGFRVEKTTIKCQVYIVPGKTDA